jgi:glycosyltransferase involved in cell wall biosynthesis
MFRKKSVCVVVPAYNEEELIGKVIRTMPDYVDKIVVIDDVSTDNTVKVVDSFKKQLGEKLILIKHDRNHGPGGAIATGYKWARDNEMGITAVMAGDNQMDPKQLHRFLKPIAENKFDYAKGNRLFTGQAWKEFPKMRYIGSAVLSILTKISSGYWHIADPQNGYTAISLNALKMLNIEKLYCFYGLPNLILVELNIYHFRVCDIHTKPIYGIGEKSSISLLGATFSLSLLLIRCFFRRMKDKFIIRDFHPLIFFYILGLVSLPVGLIGGLALIIIRLYGHPVATTTALLTVFLVISGMQSIFFAMWFDMEFTKNSKDENYWDE